MSLEPLKDVVEKGNSKKYWNIYIDSDYKQNKKIKRELKESINNNKHKQLFYSIETAHYEGIDEHPLDVMKKLGYKIIHSEPNTFLGSWNFTVENFIEPLPKYLSKTVYDFELSNSNETDFKNINCTISEIVTTFKTETYEEALEYMKSYFRENPHKFQNVKEEDLGLLRIFSNYFLCCLKR